MSKIENKYELVLNNERIFSFYKENPNINIETANIMLIDFMESIFNSMTNDLSANINSQILSFMQENKSQIENIRGSLFSINENVSKMNSDIANNMMIQFMTLKKDYIEDIRQIIGSSTLSSNEKISSLMDKNNSHLIDKTTLILNETIPKNQEQMTKQIQRNLKDFYLQIAEDTHKLSLSINGDKSLQSFIDNFETKYNSMMQTIQQPLYSFFTASEDRINKNIDTLKESSASSLSSQTKLFEELGEFLGKYKVSSNKGKYGEQNLCSILNALYGSAEVKDSHGIKASGDFIMKRLDKPTILFENKEYDRNIDKDEVAKFIRDIDTQNMNGVFISQYSGISFKHNYQIDIHKGNVLVYIQNCEYSMDKIKIAVDIIDSLSVKICELNIDETNNISKEMLDDINTEYQAFIAQKENMTMLLKDFQKRMTAQIDDLKLPVLDKYLEPKYAYVKTKTLLCDICNTFNALNKQSLSAHKRGCNKKNKKEPTAENTLVTAESSD